jgi:hypothetical protein
LPRDRAGHGIKTLLKDGNPGIQPVAIAVERLYGRSQASGFALGFLRRKLNLLCLPHEIDGCGLLAPHADRGLVGDESSDDGANGHCRPGPQPPEGTVVKVILFGEKPGKRTAGLVIIKVAQPAGTLRHKMSSAPLKAFTESASKH